MTALWLEEDIAAADACDIFAPAPLAQMNKQAQEEFWCSIAMRHSAGLGVRSQARLLKSFGGARAACDSFRIWSMHNVADSKAAEFSRGKWRASAEKEWQNALKCEARVILWKSCAYPRFLRELPDPPPLLYAIGSINLLDGPCMAIVGSRNPTSNATKIAANFGRALSAAGITIVSGLALGIDREAHMAAICEIGKSIGILGTGIDVVYPRSNRDVFEAMAQNGLLLSEFPPGLPPAASNFPIRNRIISGLSLGVVVVEAAARSGSLVTARLALEQNREVFAIPGPALDGHSAGCQNLVRQGARAVFFPDDILRDMAAPLKSFGKRLPPKPKKPADKNAFRQSMLHPPSRAIPFHPLPERPSPQAAQAAKAILGGDAASNVLAHLQKSGAMQFDALANAAGLAASQLNTILLGLEMTGKVRRLPGARYESA